MNTNATSERPERFALRVWIVIALAGAIRLLHVFFTQHYNPLAADLQLDAATYDRWARALVFGGDPGPTTLMQAPLYPWFLSIIYRIFGPNPGVVRIIQALLGTATCGLMMFCARRFFASTAAALLAGLLAALYAPLIFYEGVLLPATLIVFLNILFVAIMAAERRPGTPRLFVSGLVLGIAGAANPPTLLLFPFTVLHLRFAASRANAAPGREGPAPRATPRFLKSSLVVASGVIVALAPITVRNAVRTGEFIPLSTGAGINFYHGNNPAATGFYQVPIYRGMSLGGTPEEQSINMGKIASRESGRELSQGEVSRFWLDAGFAYIREEPRAWCSLLWTKFQFFWNGYERANVENFYFHRRFPGVLAFPLPVFGIIAPLGLLGIFLTRNRWRKLWLLYGGVATYLFTALIFYVLARYRLSIVAFLLPFAGAAVTELYSLGRSRRAAELVLSLAALGLLAFFSNMPAAKDTPGGLANNYARLGRAYVARGDTANAEESYRKALDLNAGNEAATWGLESIRRKGGPDLP